MAVSHRSPQTPTHPIGVQHPLDPMSPDEITQAAGILRQSGVVSEEVSFASMTTASYRYRLSTVTILRMSWAPCVPIGACLRSPNLKDRVFT